MSLIRNGQCRSLNGMFAPDKGKLHFVIGLRFITQTNEKTMTLKCDLDLER